MVSRIRHKGLERFFRRGIDAQHVAWLQILLTALNAASGPGDLNNPGFRLHPMKGKRKGQWAISVYGNWRLVFEFEGSNITNVDLVDYH